MMPEKILHFLTLCSVISIVVAVIKKDSGTEIAKACLGNFAALAGLIVLFCGLLQLLNYWI